ncbi:hypothetical protein, partial [Nocardia rhamnosiphila]
MKMPLKIRDELRGADEEAITGEEIHAGREVTAAELRRCPPEYVALVVELLAGHAMGEAFVLKDEVYAH